MAKEKNYERTWTVLPEPGFGDVDPDRLASELLQLQGYADNLGFATTFSPLRVKLANGTFETRGYVFRAFSVPALSEDEFTRSTAEDQPVPALEPEDELELALHGTE